MKKILSILLVSSLILMVTGCSEKKVLEEVPADTPVVEEPIETPVEEPAEPVVEEITPEEEPVSIEEERAKHSEEYVDELIAFATYTINCLYTKNDEFTNEKRREALKDVSHPMFEEKIEEMNIQLDEISTVVIKNLEIGDISGLENFFDTDIPENVYPLAFRVEYSIVLEVDGEPDSEKKMMYIIPQDGGFKFANIYQYE